MMAAAKIDRLSLFKAGVPGVPGVLRRKSAGFREHQYGCEVFPRVPRSGSNAPLRDLGRAAA